MKREEPSAGLVDTFVDEVAGECDMLVDGITVLKRIVNLRIRHGTAIEPYVDEVGLANQRLSALAHQHNLVDIRTVQVNLIVVLLTHVAGNESFVFQRVRFHHTCLDGFLNLGIKLFERTDADFLTRLLVAPDRQRSAPET